MKRFDHWISDNEELKEQREQITRALLDDLNVRRFAQSEGIPDAFIEKYPMRFYKLQQQLNLCVRCGGLEDCKLPNQGLVQSLQLEEDVLKSIMIPCNYKKEHEKRYRHLRRYRINDVPNDSRAAFIENINLETENDSGYLQAVAAIADWLIKPNTKGFYLHGNVGVGKTYLGACIANKFASDDRSVAFIHMPSFVVRIKEAFDDPMEKERLQRLAKTADLLVMDDIGAETITSWYRDEVLLPILNERMDRQLCTCFTGNLSLKELETQLKYNQKGEIEEIKALRVMERIRMLANELEIPGANRRKKR